MRLPLRVGYGTLAHLARAAAGLVPEGAAGPSAPKVLRALAGRRGIRRRYRTWGQTSRDPERPLLWMHAPSVGEGLQARPVLTLMRARHADVQLAYTHFSPSATSFAGSLDVDFRDYLVFDTPGDSAVALDALRPTALVFSKLDVWPTLVRCADERGVRLGMVSATVAHGSSRRSGAARALLADAYRRLDLVGAVDETDADRLIELGVSRDAIRVTGDTRYDQVWERATRVGADRPAALTMVGERPTVVAGSTWPSDEHALLPAFVLLRRTVRDARLVIAPHEIVPRHLAQLERWAEDAGLRVVRFGAPAMNDADVVIVDRIGILGDLYAVATAAYVGGGFHGAGLHSVLEPAAFGAPVAFGPRYQSSRDAVLLLGRGGGGSASDASSLAQLLASWLGDATLRAEAGERARALVRSGLGAAERSLRVVETLLGH